LKVVTLRIPPLRERRADVPLLVEHYLKQLCAEHGKEDKTVEHEAMEALAAFDWPGNVRQLKNAIETIVIFHQGRVVGIEDLPAELREGGGSVATTSGGVRRETSAPSTDGTPRTMEAIERQAILETLSRTGGHRAQAAHLLGIGLRTLQRKLKEYKDQGYWND
ncbi:MAG TPA: helix-turn-helix domain-containing protein, partial [Thermoanaerobaculia bacterium]|nr:helix-turn-helix domain-containing protein [Thermoanaerobaculia bacterium]